MATIQQCDKCNKTIDPSKAIHVKVSRLFEGTELCTSCAEPILIYLAKNKLLDKLRLDYMQTGNQEVS